MKKMIQRFIRLLLLVVFLGIIMIWILTPTNLHRNDWLPKIKAKTNTTYLGAQGATLLEYTFPMLFLAFLGCVYLHLGKKAQQSGNEKNGLSKWKQPVLVKGPLGVVTWIELSFIVMFVALLVWTLGTYLQISFSGKNQHSMHMHGHERKDESLWQTRLNSAAFRVALVGNLCFVFLFFPVTRGSSVLPLIGLTSESSIKYHIWLGHIVLTLFSAHTLGYIVYWASTDQLAEMLKWDNVGVSNIAGELAMLLGLALWATTYPKIRRKMFELFFYTHYLYIPFIILYIFHAGIRYFCMMLPGVYLFLIDRYLRFLQSRQSVRLLSSRLLPCQTVELNFSKRTDLVFNTTSILFINVPSISKLQWHPFTISSNSNLEPEKLSIVIKMEGSWSQKLYQLLSTPSSLKGLEVAVEGPYGPPSTNFLSHDTLVMVSGGSGITPFFSIIRELIFMSSAMDKKLPQILLICAFKTGADFTMLDLLLPISGTPADISRLQLQIEAYVTREKQQNADKKSTLIQTIWFKPRPSDKPISGILGTNYWLWLGVIISCSFVIFLILLGLITRYYIYPIDHNTNKIYSSASRAAINMLIICMSIWLVASVVVLKNKNQNAMEGKQIQNTDTQTPTSSPGSIFQNDDRELESLPSQSLVQATNVHYGSRPDLKKILLEVEGSSVGVLVSGPKLMRHDVATICSSGLADNLHFESISFSW